MITDQMVEAGAEVAYLRNREGSIAWAELSTQHKSEWRERVRPVITAANAAAWRPVKDSLPEFGRVVLVSYNSGFSGKTVLAFGSRIDAGECWLWGIQNGYAGGVHLDEDAWWNGVEADDEYKVTHWQPLTLPAPPATPEASE